MKTWQAGREISLLEDIKNGAKTVEGRLYRGKFAEYQIGDHVSLRADVYDTGGNLQTEIPDQALVAITAIERFASFREMLEQTGYPKVIPRAESLDAATAEYAKFYSHEDEVTYGVVAIHIKLLEAARA